MTVHRWYANKSCPGDYLYERHGYIADEVNKLLGASTSPTTPSTSQPTNNTTSNGQSVSGAFKVGEIVQFTGGAVYTSANAATPAHSRGKSRCKVTQTYNGKHPYHLVSEDGGGVYGWVETVDVTAISGTATKKTVDEIAKEVIAGKWGNGDARIQKLTAAGYDYSAVQKRVNELL